MSIFKGYHKKARRKIVQGISNRVGTLIGGVWQSAAPVINIPELGISIRLNQYKDGLEIFSEITYTPEKKGEK